MEVTNEGLRQMKSQLEKLKEKLNAASIRKTQMATHTGDPWNVGNGFILEGDEEFQLARRIYDLSEAIKNATIIEVTNTPGIVNLNSTVTLKLIFGDGDEEEFTYRLTDVNSGMVDSITIQSPLGKEIFGKKVGETGCYNAPMGEVNFQILSID